jgi:hypothetical protein
MAMSEMKQKLLLHELVKLGFPGAAYMPESGIIMVQPDNDRMPVIYGNGEISYGAEHDGFASNTLKPIVAGVSESADAWDKSRAMPFDELSKFRVLAEYNGIMLAARDDTGYGRGLHFVTWQYNYDRTGLDHGHYTENYNAAKEDFAVRSGLIPDDKLLTPEQVSDIKAAIEYRRENDGDLTYEADYSLHSVLQRLNAAYPAPGDAENLSEQEYEYDITSLERDNSASVINRDIYPGDWVIAANNNDYGYLIGTVTAIDNAGTPEHGTDNETDDIHVDFTAFDYPPERIAEIEKHFSVLLGEHKPFGELALDDVIMAPSMLISMSHMGLDEIKRMGSLRHNCEVFCNCFPGAVKHDDDREAALMKRISKNLRDYHDSLTAFGTGELIDMAGKINAMSEMHTYMSYHNYSDEELDYLLQFKSPLEVVADAWNDRRSETDEMSDFLYDLCDKQNALRDYPLENEPDPTQEKEPPSEAQSRTEWPAAEKPKPVTLAERLKAANEKAKAQDTAKGGNPLEKSKPGKRDERE